MKGARRLGVIVLNASIMSACATACSTAPAQRSGAVAAAPTVASADSIDVLVRRHYPEGLPFSAIRQAGPAALPGLGAMLADPAQRQWWPNVAGAIGIIGGAEASSALIGFIQAHDGRVLDADTYRAALTAVAALGYVAHDGDARALDFIAAAARRIDLPAPPAGALRLTQSVMGVQAMLALGLSARPEARAVLEELQRSGSEATRARSIEALRTHAQVGRVGLAAYLQRQ